MIMKFLTATNLKSSKSTSLKLEVCEYYPAPIVSIKKNKRNDSNVK